DARQRRVVDRGLLRQVEEGQARVEERLGPEDGLGEGLLGVVGRGADGMDVGRVELGREDALPQQAGGQGAGRGGVRQDVYGGVVGAVIAAEALVEVDQ